MFNWGTTSGSHGSMHDQRNRHSGNQPASPMATSINSPINTGSPMGTSVGSLFQTFTFTGRRDSSQAQYQPFQSYSSSGQQWVPAATVKAFGSERGSRSEPAMSSSFPPISIMPAQPSWITSMLNTAMGSGNSGTPNFISQPGSGDLRGQGRSGGFGYPKPGPQSRTGHVDPSENDFDREEEHDRIKEIARLCIIVFFMALLLYVCYLIVSAVVFAIVVRSPGSGPAPPPAPVLPGYLAPCPADNPCPKSWVTSEGGYFCLINRGCRPANENPFPVLDCAQQCFIGNPPEKRDPRAGSSGGGGILVPVPGTGQVGLGGTGASVQPKKLLSAGNFDLRINKAGKLIGCASPVGLFPGQPKYGCSGQYATAATCDAAPNPIKDTKYVSAVHAGCLTAEGKGTYGYAYDDGVGLKQCSPLTRYEWILCPDGSERTVDWPAESGISWDSTKRFRVTNKCNQPIWIQQAGDPIAMLPLEKVILRIESGSSYTYSVPNKGLPSTRYLPKTGCDESGNACDIQSMPPCPIQGCDLPIDTKFEASWGCLYARSQPTDTSRCSLTGQGFASTYQDWWDGSAVDGWTLPFSVLVNNGGHGLSWDESNSAGADQCGDVICAGLNAASICPVDEYLTP